MAAKSNQRSLFLAFLLDFPPPQGLRGRGAVTEIYIERSELLSSDLFGADGFFKKTCVNMRKIDKTGAWSVRHSSPCEGIIFDEWGRNAEKVRKKTEKLRFFMIFCLTNAKNGLYYMT